MLLLIITIIIGESTNRSSLVVGWKIYKLIPHGMSNWNCAWGVKGALITDQPCSPSMQGPLPLQLNCIFALFQQYSKQRQDGKIDGESKKYNGLGWYNSYFIIIWHRVVYFAILTGHKINLLICIKCGFWCSKYKHNSSTYLSRPLSGFVITHHFQ